ncbi:hypothetical protein D3C76_994500 [compost metagenome]
MDEERHSALTALEFRMSFAEQFEELLKMADKCQRQGVITIEEKDALVLEATEHYSRAVEGLGQST